MGGSIIEGRHENPDESELNIDPTGTGVPTFTPPVHLQDFPNQPILDATTYAYNSIDNQPINNTGEVDVFHETPFLQNIFNDPQKTTSLNDVGSNIMFQAGIGFPGPKVLLQLATEGGAASLPTV